MLKYGCVVEPDEVRTKFVRRTSTRSATQLLRYSEFDIGYSPKKSRQADIIKNSC